MKKTLSAFLALIISLSFVFSIPFTAQAATYKPDRKIYAHAYMLINLDDDSCPVVAEKNSDERLYPASLTKIATAMVVINKVKDLKAKTKMSQTAYDAILGSGAQVAGIKVGQELTVDKLLYLTMVHSACDACQVLAEYVSGTCEAFVAEMNAWAKSIGCKDTNFVNPDGLHDPNHYTTARDMATMTIEALKNADFVRYATATEVEFGGYTLGHTNLMLHPGYVTYYYEYAQGIKTGSTEEADYCVITKASKDGYNYLAVVMKSPRKKIKNQSYETKCSFVDAKSLFEWAFDSLKYTTLVNESEVVNEVAVKNGKDADTVQLVAKENVNVIVPAGLDKSAVIFKPVDKPEYIEAPVSKGQPVCSAEIIYADEVIATVDLVAGDNIELSTFLTVVNAIKAFFSSTAVKIIFVALFIAVLFYIYLLYKNFTKKKNRRRSRQSAEEEMEDRRRNAQSRSDDYLPPPKRRNK
jgi:D-alanyl-D-alanine carboxypeptidase (penicillin-binding protein 5/6)